MSRHPLRTSPDHQNTKTPNRLALILLAFATSALAADPAPGSAPPTAAPDAVRQIKVLTDKAPDCSSLQSIIASVTREARTNDEKAIALYHFMNLTHYHLNYPSEPGGIGALKAINVYGWALCGGLHSIQAALWRELGWEWRFVGWSNPGHTTVEARYDGRWHYVDVFLRYYTWLPDENAPGGRTIAGEMDLKANPALITDALEFDKARKVYFHKGNAFELLGDKANWRAPAFLVCGDDPPGIVSGTRTCKIAGSPTGWNAINFDSPGYSTDVNLLPGWSLTLDWAATPGAHWWGGRKYVPGHTCGDKDYRNCPVIGPILEPYAKSGGQRRSYANGRLLFAPDLSSPAALAGFAAKDNVKLEGGKLLPAQAGKPASITLSLQSPYIMTRATAVAEGADRAELSLDGGKTWKAVQPADFSDAVGGKYAALLRLTFAGALTALKVEVIVQHNRCALPYLSPGRNQVTVSLADAKELGDNQLVVTYAYHPGSRSKSYEDLCAAGAEVGRAHYAAWSDQPVVVQKTLTARDLPATFAIDIPTPKGKFPVYPRMAFLRREVLPAGGKPLPLPAGAAPPAPAADDELPTLPNPFTVGFAKAPPKVARTTSTQTFDLAVSHAVSADGQAAPNHFVKTKEGETWALLIGGDLKNLPAPGAIAAARLIVPITRTHTKSATKVGVTLLTAPFAPGKPFDFKQLGEVIGTANLPPQPGDADYTPPKLFSIDLTRALKALAAGDARFHGLGLRTVPDRGVDEGWTVRFDVPPAAKVKLELDVYQ